VPGRVLCIMGPTGSGKSDLAVELAQRLSGHVINADSMQVYRGLAIATAAPGPDDLARAPHHLYGCLALDESPDAGWYAREAASVVKAVAAQGHLPIVVGGTFFWMRALFSGLDEIPPVPPEVRAEVRDELARHGAEALHKRLSVVDPVSAARLRPRDSQRVARAMEVFLATGTPLSAFQRAEARPGVEADVMRLVLTMPRPDLYARIEARVDRMLQAGLLPEVRAALEAGFSPECRPLRASSIAPVVRHCLGEIGAEEMRAKVAQAHRNYAKRQMTWLRAERDVCPVDARERDRVFALVSAFVHVA